MFQIHGLQNHSPVLWGEEGSWLAAVELARQVTGDPGNGPLWGCPNGVTAEITGHCPECGLPASLQVTDCPNCGREWQAQGEDGSHPPIPLQHLDQDEGFLRADPALTPVCPGCGYDPCRCSNTPINSHPIAVLSTVVLPVDGAYRVETLDLRSGLSALDAHCQDGPILHFIGHPATRKVIEACGAVYAGQGVLFEGLKVGEWALCFPIAQGKSDRSKGGSAIHQEVGEADLSCRRVIRLA